MIPRFVAFRTVYSPDGFCLESKEQAHLAAHSSQEHNDGSPTPHDQNTASEHANSALLAAAPALRAAPILVLPPAMKPHLRYRGVLTLPDFVAHALFMRKKQEQSNHAAIAQQLAKYDGMNKSMRSFDFSLLVFSPIAPFSDNHFKRYQWMHH